MKRLKLEQMKAWRRITDKEKYFKLAAEANQHYKEQCGAYRAAQNTLTFFPKIAETSKKINKRSGKPPRKDIMIEKDQTHSNETNDDLLLITNPIVLLPTTLTSIRSTLLNKL